jgi:hypothetical protein
MNHTHTTTASAIDQYMTEWASAPVQFPASSGAPRHGCQGRRPAGDSRPRWKPLRKACWRPMAKDMDAGRASGLEPALLDRLEMTPKGVKAMAQGLREVAAQSDPIGEITDLKYRPSGIQVGKCGCRWASSASFTNRARM